MRGDIERIISPRSLSPQAGKAPYNGQRLFYPILADIRRFLSATTFGRLKDESTPSAFEFTHGKTIWKYLEESLHQTRNFDLWMRERRKHEESLWHTRFPPCVSLSSASLKKDPEAVLLVDVGGASGSQVMDFKAQFPHLPGRTVLQDLFPPKSNELPQQSEGLEIMAYDFFTPQPLKGARFYYFRHVFHNWPDEKCSDILQQVVLAMEPGYSTLLIDDYVLPTKNTQLRGAVEDILKMATLNSLERTLELYEKLLRAAGLEVVNIFASGGNEEAIIEAKVAMIANP